MASNQKPSGAGAPARATKAERKERARRERIELQRRMARARRNRTIGIAGLVVAAIAVVGVLALTSSDGGKRTTGNGALAGMMTGPSPWPANLDALADRLGVLELPPFGGTLHWHSHLDIVVNGAPVTVPADVGWGSDVQSPLHTHDDTGTIHLESGDANATFTLGEFFDVWGLKLTPTCIGGLCDSGGTSLRAFVDGRPYQGDPRQIQLKDQEEIVLTYGSASQVPDPLPTFDWSTLQP